MDSEPDSNPIKPDLGSNNKTWLWIVLAIILALILVGTFYFLRLNKKSETTSDTTSMSNTATTSAKTWQAGKVAISGKFADADVVDIGNGQFRMYYSAEPEVAGFKGQVYSAVSADGITWTKEAGERKEWGTFPDVIKLPDGRFRMYFQNAGVIKSATSTDGLTFTDEAGTRINSEESEYDLENVAAPTTTRLSDGSYLMVYRGSYATKYAADVPNNNTQLFFYATSIDGLSWQKKGVALDSKNETFYGLLDGPDWVKYDNNEMRLYFWSYTGVYFVTYKDGVFSTATLALSAGTDSMVKFVPNPPGDPTLAKIKDTWFLFYGQHEKGIYYSILK